MPSRTLIQESCAAGLPVALQYIVTFLLSFSITVIFCGPWTIFGTTVKKTCNFIVSNVAESHRIFDKSYYFEKKNTNKQM